jgi:hypothetical protein
MVDFGEKDEVMAMIFVVFIEILEVLVLRRLVLLMCYDVLRFTFTSEISTS